MSDVAIARPAFELPAAAVAATAPTAATAASCMNCGAELHAAFCGDCGESAATNRLTLRALAHEAVAQVVELDHGVLHTFVDLMRNPGAMVRGYVNGRRRKYTGPITFVALATALSMLEIALIPEQRKLLDAMVDKPTARTLAVFGPERFAMYSELSHLLMSNRFLIDAALLIPIMLAIRFLFRKRGINLAEAGVFTAYALGVSTFLGVALNLVLHVLRIDSATISLSQLLMIGVFLYAGFGFFGRSFSTAWRVVAVWAIATLAISTTLVGLPFLLVHPK